MKALTPTMSILDEERYRQWSNFSFTRRCKFFIDLKNSQKKKIIKRVTKYAAEQTENPPRRCFAPRTFAPYMYLFSKTKSQYGQLPVGLIAQLEEHCTGITEVMGSNPVQAWMFFRLSFRNFSSCVNNCKNLSSI